MKVFLGLCLALACAVHAETITGRVIGIADGDTVTVLDASKVQHRIRLAGIDAPEKAQAFGQRSKVNLSEAVFGRQVVVHTDKTDKYERLVGKILVNGVDANLGQIQSGLAWHYKNYQSEQSAADRIAYANAEDAARAARIGLWRDPQPMPPWEWRHGGKNVPTPKSIASGCPCNSEAFCNGPKGGQYCVAPNGKKKYR